MSHIICKCTHRQTVITIIHDPNKTDIPAAERERTWGRRYSSSPEPSPILKINLTKGNERQSEQSRAELCKPSTHICEWVGWDRGGRGHYERESHPSKPDRVVAEGESSKWLPPEQLHYYTQVINLHIIMHISASPSSLSLNFAIMYHAMSH